MFLLSARCSFSCLLIIALTGLLQIINAESFRPIFNPNAALKPTAKKITAIATTTSTIRPLTTISATLKSRVSLTNKQQAPSQQPSRAPVKPLSAPSLAPARTLSDNTKSDSKDAPVAEALRNPYYRSWRRPYYSQYPSSNYPSGNYPSSNLLPAPRYRRRPNPKPYYSPPSYYSSPYEDYRFETDFLDQNSYVPKPKKPPTTIDTGKDYGIIDTDIGQFYDAQSATYNVPPLKTYDTSYYNTGAGGTGGGSGGGVGGGAGGNIGTGPGVVYSDYADVDDYKYASTTKPKTIYKSLPSRAPIQQPKTRTKYVQYDEDYRYSSDTSAYGTSAPEIEEITTDQNTVAKYNNVYLPQQTVYQTAPKSKSKPRPKPPKTPTTTYTPPIKFSDTSIDVLTKPLGSATFNLNLSPGTVYNQPPSLSYNPAGVNYKPIQPIPIQPPATSYGVPIAPPLNAYTYQNAYQNQFAGYPPSIAQNSGSYVNPSQISITSPGARSPGQFAEPPPLNQQHLSNIDVNYNSIHSSYDATPKTARPTKRKPSKVNSKRVSTKPPPLNTDEELADEERSDQSDYYGESYSFYKTMPQPALPNAYDQEEFHTVKNKRKQPKQPKQTVSFYYERDEKTRTTKKPKQPIEVTLRIPDEDYLDDLVKVVQTTKRPKKKNRPTTSHVLDTEDLRDAYDNNAAYYPKKKSKSRTRYANHETGEYDNYEDDGDDEDYDNDRVSSVNSKEEAKSTPESDTNAEQESQDSPYWDKTSSIYKQYGIRARNDHFPVGSSYEVREYNNGFRPIRSRDRSEIFIASSSNNRPTYVREIPPAVDDKYSNRMSSTVRSATTTKTVTKPTTLYVWDGKVLPKNHKLI